MGRKKMGEQRRLQILEGLRQAALKKGLQNCNMSDVAREAGVSRGILHYYFKNKDEMITALVANLRDTHFLQFQASVDDIEDHLEKLKTSLWYPVSTFGAAGADLVRMWIEFWGAAAYHPEIEDFIRDLQTGLRQHFTRVITEGMLAGRFRKDASAPQLASIVLGSLEGFILQWRFNPQAFSFSNALVYLEEMLVEHLIPKTDHLHGEMGSGTGNLQAGKSFRAGA